MDQEDLQKQYDNLEADYETLLNDRTGLWLDLSQSSVDAYLDSLDWSDQATEREKTLVIGNVRAFASHVRGLAAKRKM